jgi:hypothetical protein
MVTEEKEPAAVAENIRLKGEVAKLGAENATLTSDSARLRTSFEALLDAYNRLNNDLAIEAGKGAASEDETDVLRRSV